MKESVYVACLECSQGTLDAVFQSLAYEPEWCFKGFHDDVSKVILNKLKYNHTEFAAVNLSRFQPSGLDIDIVIFDRPMLKHCVAQYWNAPVIIISPPASLHQNLADWTTRTTDSSNAEIPLKLRRFCEVYKGLITEAALLCTTKSASKSHRPSS